MPLIIAPSIRATICVRTTRSVSTPASRMPPTSSNLKPGEPLHHQHPPGHQVGVRARHDVAVLAELVEHRRDVEHVGGLDAEVELLDDRVGEQLDERRRVGQRGDRDAPDEVRRQPRHRPQIGVHEPADVGSLHLDDDVLAACAGGRRGPGRSSAAASGRVSNDVNTGSSGRPSSDSTVRRTTSNGSAGTWSRQRLNSSTSSGGNRPSPDEMTWPSLMNVGPSASAASRRRCDSSAMPADPSARPRLRRTSHGTTARARRDVTTTPRRPGGRRRGVISVGTSCWASRRSCSASAHHVIASRSSTHGASSANAPHCRSSRCRHRLHPGIGERRFRRHRRRLTHVVPSAW